MAKTKSTMSSFLEADFYKLSKQKSTYICLALSFALLVVVYVIMWLAPQMLEKLADTAPNDADLFVLEEGLKEQVYSFSSSGYVGLFVAIISGIFIGKEFSKGMVRTTIARGASRVKFYFSKWISVVSLALAYTLFTLIISLIINAIVGYGEMTSSESIALVRCIGLQFLSIISVTSIYVMLGFVTRSSGAAIGTSIGLDILLSFILTLITIIPTESGDTNWLSFMPFQQLSLASTSQDLTAVQWVAVTLMPIVYTAISCFVGCFSFAKRDIK